MQTALALVNAGADPNTRQTPLPAPAFTSLINHLLHPSPPRANTTPTALLLACGYDIDQPEYADLSIQPPHEDVRLVQAMLAHGANVNAQNTNKSTALHLAVMCNRLNTVELLLQHGTNVNAQDNEGWSALTNAILHDSGANVISALLAHGANPNLRARDGETPLSLARFWHHSDFVRLLLRKGK